MRWKPAKATAIGLKINTPHRRSGLLILSIGSGGRGGIAGEPGSEAMMRFKIAIAAAVVLSLGGIAGYLLPLP